jgi:IS4 transposase
LTASVSKIGRDDAVAIHIDDLFRAFEGLADFVDAVDQSPALRDHFARGTDLWFTDVGVAAQEILYLFTTLQESAEQVTELYKERWNIETDLRSLKEQMRLHTIPARSPALVATELLIAIATYNLIRAVMGQAAKQNDIDPKRLSFSRSREMFWAFARAVPSADSEQELEHRWQVMLRSIAQCRVPKRKRPPAPRVVWGKPHGFPRRK